MSAATFVRDRLREEWQADLAPFRVRPAAAAAVFAELTRAYSEPGRHYHTLKHVQYVLAMIEQLRPPPPNRAAVRLAAWFHDAVYDPRAKDNEEHGANLAAEKIAALGLPDALREPVRRLILLTKHHRAEPGDGDGHALLDADLAILGDSFAAYARYARQVRQEYAWVSDAAYRAGRIEVLRGFLSRPRIYQTEGMFAAREAKARRNLAREIERLARPPQE